MTRSYENRCFRRFQESRDPRLLAKVFDATAAELLRVAGHLANGNVEWTQDALQATFLTAIEQADSYDPERDVRPWLLGILANHVRKERRANRQRGVAAIDDALADGLAGDFAQDSPIARAEGREFGLATKQAMKRLPTPFREVIVLHLQHGLNAAEIGEALGRPAGTVRTQVVRGLDRLRALLPAGFTAAALGMVLTPGPILAAVRGKVLASLPPIAVGSSSLLFTGWRLYAMIAAGVTVVLSVLIPLLSTGVPEPPQGAVVSVDGTSVAAEQVGVDRLLVVQGATPEPTPQAKPKKVRKSDPNLQRVALKVVYEDGTPAENVPIVIGLQGVQRRWHTGDRGRLELHLPWPGMHTMYVVGTRVQDWFHWFGGLSRPRVVKKRVVIPKGMTLDVRVVDGDGNPVVGATVESSHGGGIGASMLTVLGQTDADGRFVRRHVGARGQLRVWGDGYQPSRIADANGDIGGTMTKKFTLSKPGHACRGVARDELGRTVAGAQMALVQLQPRPLEPQFFESGEDGSFELSTLGTGAHVIVAIHHGEVLRRGQARFRHGGSGSVQVDVPMTRGAKVVGSLKAASNNPMGGTNVVARDRPEAIHSLPFLTAWTTTLTDGSFELEGLLPGVYELESDGFDSKVVTLAEGETQAWHPVQQALLPISIRLLDALGNPLDGWRVFLIEPGAAWSSHGDTTGPDGRFGQYHKAWEYPAGSSCRFVIHSPLGLSENRWDDYSQLPNLITPPLLVGMEHEVRVPVGVATTHTLNGAIVDSAHQPLVGAEVSLFGRSENMWFERRKTDEEGVFRFEGVPPGRFRMRIKSAGKPSFVTPIYDLREQKDQTLGPIVIPVAGRIRVSVPPSATADGAKVRLVDSQGRTHRMRKQKDGTFRSYLLFYGSYELQGWTRQTWAAPQTIELDKTVVQAELVLVPHKATKLTVELPPGYRRNTSAWQGDLVARRNGVKVFEHSLRRSFAGEFMMRMQFEVPLPPGSLDLRIECWHKRPGKVHVEVPAAGGGAATVRIE